MILQEGNLKFNFTDAVDGFKFDETDKNNEHYHGLSHCMKALDFIVEWFREREDLENENGKYKDALFKPDDFQFPDTQLKAVRMALNEFLPEFKNLTVRRNSLRMEIDKNGKTLFVDQLSYGKNVDRVLEDLMGLETTRPDKVNRLLTELYETISAGNTDKAKEQAASLRDLIGKDPEIVRAIVLIKRQEILRK